MTDIGWKMWQYEFKVGKKTFVEARSRPESRKEIVIESVTGREAYLEMRSKLFFSKLS